MANLWPVFLVVTVILAALAMHKQSQRRQRVLALGIKPDTRGFRHQRAIRRKTNRFWEKKSAAYRQGMPAVVVFTLSSLGFGALTFVSLVMYIH
jgi:hypothetical protein